MTTWENTKGTVYEKYNVVDAIKGDLVPITTVELPAGNYMIFASNSVNKSQEGMISCSLKASSGNLSSMEMRGISNNGGGLLECAYFTTTTKSTVTSFGHGPVISRGQEARYRGSDGSGGEPLLR